jgi:hypothetical protein
MAPLDLDPLRLALRLEPTAPVKPPAKEKPPRHKPGKKFLKGPVPLAWLALAAQLPGKSLHVGVVVWFLAGLKKTKTVSLSSKQAQLFGVDRHAKRRALAWLEQAGLVAVERRSGRNPRVTLLSAAD